MAENFKKNYIEYLYSLSKESPYAPWKIEYPNPLDIGKKITLYIENSYHQAGSILDSIQVVSTGESFQYILKNIFPTISKYPYRWPLEGISIDTSGYDFFSNFDETGNARFIEITDSARVIVWEKLNIKAPQEDLELPLVKEEYVTGKHLTKLQLTFGKAGPVSSLDINLHTIKDVKILSIVYESDIVRYVVPKIINLNEISTDLSSDTFNLKFGKAIFAKRITIVLAQNNSDINSYSIKNNNPEENIYSKPTIKDNIINDISSLVDKNINNIDFSNMNNNYKKYLQTQKEIKSYDIYKTDKIYTDDEISDWSEERKTAYLKWREKALSYKNLKGGI